MIQLTWLVEIIFWENLYLPSPRVALCPCPFICNREWISKPPNIQVVVTLTKIVLIVDNEQERCKTFVPPTRRSAKIVPERNLWNRNELSNNGQGPTESKRKQHFSNKIYWDKCENSIKKLKWRTTDDSCKPYQVQSSKMNTTLWDRCQEKLATVSN